MGKAGSILPTRREEEALYRQGYSLVAGLDEAGRGCLAGPVVAGAVVLHREMAAPWLLQVRDSKLLSSKQRERLYDRIQSEAMAFGAGVVGPEDIDRQGIVESTRRAMGQALARLPLQPQYLLVDGFPLQWRGLPCKAIIDGDARCLSIAAASIVAKVTRDHLMEGYDREYAGYGFARHKGYGTPEHLITLRRLGPSPIHRRSFHPVGELERGPRLSDDSRARTGSRGERAAATYLESKGCAILARNYRTPWGELDLVVRDGEYLVFVEVRTRRSDALGLPEESITAPKARRLVASAQDYLQQQGLEDALWRIDLVAVGPGRGEHHIRHIPNAVEL